MTTAEKLATIAENEQKLYDTGYENGIADQKAESVDWDVIQDYGKRTAYNRAFAAWGLKVCNPKYLITPATTGFINAFQACTELEMVDWDKFDLSQCTSFSQTFNSCFKLKSIDTKLVPASFVANCWDYAFSGCRELTQIQEISAMKDHTWTYTFNRCDNLKEIRFSGEIGKTINFGDCKKLSRKSIDSIIYALTTNDTGVRLTLSKTAIDNAYGIDIDVNDETTYGGFWNYWSGRTYHNLIITE